MLIIENPAMILPHDLNVTGAAIRILIAGGPALSDAEMKRASGCSYHLWKTKGAEIRDLVERIATQEAAT